MNEDKYISRKGNEEIFSRINQEKYISQMTNVSQKVRTIPCCNYAVMLNMKLAVHLKL